MIKAVRVRKSFRATQLSRFKDAKALLLDSFDAKQRGGTGKAFDWSAAGRVNGGVKIFLAGGITPENEEKRFGSPGHTPWMCAAGGRKPGKKDAKRLTAFMRAVEEAREKRLDEFRGENCAGRARSVRLVWRPIRAGNADGAARRARAGLRGGERRSARFRIS